MNDKRDTPGSRPNVASRMLDAMTYDGNRFGKAWRSFLACYFYTRSFDGAEINEQGDTISFGRWYSFRCAVELAWDDLTRRSPSTCDLYPREVKGQ